MAEKGNNRPLNHPKWDSLAELGETFSSAFQTWSKNVSGVCPEQDLSRWVGGRTGTFHFYPGPKSHKCLFPIVWELILDIVPLDLPTSSQ